jgi:uncharacterized Zn finger protein (UPF0148 family)
MPKILTCDKCGKHPAYEDYDGAILCKQHEAQKKIPQLQETIDSLEEEMVMADKQRFKLQEDMIALKRVAGVE